MPDSARRIFVGDVQGCAQELQDLLDAVSYDPLVDRIYAVGDVVNRGPDSADATRLLRSLGAVTVVGNHELHCFEVAAGRRQAGPRDTLDDLFQASDGEELLDWLRTRPVLHVEEDLVLVHAGLHPAWTNLEHAAQALSEDLAQVVAGHAVPEGLRAATCMRYCDPDGRQPELDWPEPEAPFAPWDHHYQGTRTVVFGHWARRGLVVEGRVRGLDSGCVYGKHLSAWIAEEDRIVQVPARQTWCRV